MKLFNLIKTTFGMLAAYLLVVLMGSNIFLKNSPKINMEYIASLRETPSKISTYLSSLGSQFGNRDKILQEEIETLKKETGVVEIAISTDEQKKLADSISQSSNPLPNAIFNYVSRGVAASVDEKSKQGVVRIDPSTNIKYKRFSRPDGTFLDVMIVE